MLHEARRPSDLQLVRHHGGRNGDGRSKRGRSLIPRSRPDPADGGGRPVRPGHGPASPPGPGRLDQWTGWRPSRGPGPAGGRIPRGAQPDTRPVPTASSTSMDRSGRSPSTRLAVGSPDRRPGAGHRPPARRAWTGAGRPGSVRRFPALSTSPAPSFVNDQQLPVACYGAPPEEAEAPTFRNSGTIDRMIRKPAASN
jgi:hypothetical protein